MTDLAPPWTPELRARVHPRRRHGVRRDLPSGAMARIAAHYKSRREAIARGRTFQDAEYAALQREVVHAFEEGAALTPRAAGAATVLLAGGIDARFELEGLSLGAALADAWLEVGGGPLLVAAAAASTAFSSYRDPKEREALVLGPHVTVDGEYRPTEQGMRFWEAVRERVATMPDDALAGARAEAERAWPTVSDAARFHLAFAFPDEPSWTRDAARWVLATTDEGLAFMALAFVTDAALAEELVRLASDRGGHLSHAALDVADALGDAADAPLLALAEACLRGWYDDGGRHRALEALALVRTPRVAAWLVANLENKFVRATASEVLRAEPRLSLPLLAPLVASRKASLRVEALLASAVRSAPAIAREVEAASDEPTARVLRELRAAEEPVPDADPSELPPVLVAPPWAEKKARAKKKVTALALAVPPYAERIDWSHVPKPAVQNIASSPDDAEPRLGADGTGIYLWQLAKYSDAKVLEILAKLPGTRFYWFDASELTRLVARFDLAIVTPLLGFAERPADLIAALEPVVSPRVTPLMAHALRNVRRARRVAERWLLRYPDVAALGLLPDALGADKKRRENAGRALRFLAAAGKRAAIEEVAAQYGDACTAALPELLAGEDLAEGAPKKAPALPAFFDPALLSRPRLAGGERALPLEAVRRLGEMLAFCDPDEPYVGLEQVREACDPVTLGRFAWDLYAAWGLAGFPADEKWALYALGFFGRDEHAIALAADVRSWPSEGAFGRAVLGLDALAMIGTDRALMLVHGIAQKAKSRPLLERAKEKIESIADRLGLTAEDLADRIVPELGLDDDGSRILDFGPRRFRVGFDEHLVPFVRDDEGARLKDLPKPGKNDDPEKATASASAWKALKKDVRAIAVAQLARFEAAMIARRRWDAEAFRAYVVEHPLVGQIARRLVLGAFDGEGRLLGTFRVAEDRSYASQEDEPFVLPEDAKVGVIHPLEVEPAVLAKWGDRFSDYELLQPFAQLSRDVPRGLTTDALGALVPVDTLKLLGLERRGWRRGAAGDGGIIDSFEREAGTYRARLALDPGVHAGDPKYIPTQTPRGVGFFDVVRGPVAQPDPIFLAEVAADLRAVGALG